MRTLDRYVLKNFLVPFLLCFFGFIAIWLVFDIMNNANEFLENKISPNRIAYYYATQLPLVMVLSMPLGELLALLFSLSKMSRSNEIISMLTAGQSVTRILLPLFAFGFFLTAACFALEHDLAPHAEATRKALQDEFRGKSGVQPLEQQLFRNRVDFRTWYVQSIRPDLNALQGVHITQQDANGNFVAKYYANVATFDRSDKSWNLRNSRVTHFNAQGDLTFDLASTQKIQNWSETPWRIISANLEPENLSMPELREYLDTNADFPEPQLAAYKTYLDYRWAVPWACLVVILIAAPLGIVYSRRGVLAGVASSIFIFFGLFFLGYLFLALGKGDRVPPAVAAWFPNALFAALGLFLLWMRSTNRDFPTLATMFASSQSRSGLPSERRLPPALPESEVDITG